VRWRGWILAAWGVLALLFWPKATHVQRVLAVRGSAVEQSESGRASELIRQAFPNPIADYVAIVVHGPVRYTHPRCYPARATSARSYRFATWANPLS
jgi:hypothetical protein